MSLPLAVIFIVSVVVTLIGCVKSYRGRQGAHFGTSEQSSFWSSGKDERGRRADSRAFAVKRRAQTIAEGDGLRGERAGRGRSVAGKRRRGQGQGRASMIEADGRGTLERWMALVRRLWKRPAAGETAWVRMGMALAVIFCVGAFMLNSLFSGATLSGMIFWQSTPSVPLAHTSNAFQGSYHASAALQRLSQLDALQYSDNAEYQVWSLSACSTAAMTEVLDAYGQHYRIADVLKIEAGMGEITPQQGLLEDAGIERTVAKFGFKTAWGHNLSLEQILHIANSGEPVIVSWPPDRYAGGHLVVVTGGDSQNVFLADSSIWNRRSLTHEQFLKWWEGFYAIVTPN